MREVAHPQLFLCRQSTSQRVIVAAEMWPTRLSLVCIRGTGDLPILKHLTALLPFYVSLREVNRIAP